jgi:hypothetical protein
MTDSSGKPYLDLKDGTNSFAVTAPTAQNDGAWHHLVAVRDQTNDTAFLYVDGVLAGSMDISSLGDVVDTFSNIVLGAANTLSTSPFTGTTDEAALWGRALSADEVHTLYMLGQEIAASHEGGYCGGDYYVEGTVNAESYIDRSLIYTGEDALEVLSRMHAIPGAIRGAFAEVDHNAIGPMLVEGKPLHPPAEGSSPPPRRLYRDLSKQIQINSAAILELQAIIRAQDGNA